MPIKKSILEQKWYFRDLKVIFSILPVLVLAVFYLNGRIIIPAISQNNIADLLQKNFLYLIYLVVGLVLYYAVLPRIFFYLIFGGLEDDTKSADPAEPVVPAKNSAVAPIIIILLIIVFATAYQTGHLSFVHLGSHTYGSSCTNSKGQAGIYGTNGNCITCSSGSTVTSPGANCSTGVAGVYCCASAKCVATPCDAIGAWYCVGTYYLGGQQLQFNGCSQTNDMRSIYSSWSGSCRKCP
jgi:hypothetical protein